MNADPYLSTIDTRVCSIENIDCEVAWTICTDNHRSGLLLVNATKKVSLEKLHKTPRRVWDVLCPQFRNDSSVNSWFSKNSTIQSLL